MKTKQLLPFAAIVLSVLAAIDSSFGQGTAFTYQGRLNNGASPANGSYDLQFTVYDSTNLPGTVVAGPVTNLATGVTNGLFTVTLDFGAGVFTGPDRWLEIGVRTAGGGGFATLSPRQKMTPTPYAIMAGSASVSAGYSGPIALSQLPPTVALLNSNQTFTGVVSFSNPSNSFTGGGSGLTGVPFSTLNGGSVETLFRGNFVLTNTFGTGSTPNDTGDMNGDGRIDLICIDSSGAILVMTNDGNSSFGLRASSGSGCFTAKTVDFNGDGKLDVLALSSSNVLVFTNTGTGGIALSSSTPTGGGARAIAIADFNGDGRPDVVTADFNAGTLTVLTNNGSGGLGFFTTLSGAGPNVWNVIAVDVDGDHRPDIISCALSGSIISGNLSVFLNNAGAGFTLASSPTTGVNPLAIAAADFNGDGKPDLVTADYGSFGVGTTLTVLINTGSGNFVPSAFPTVGTGPFYVVTADVNGDGKMDILEGSSGSNASPSNSVTVLTNDGSGGFVASQTIPNVTDPLAVDINGDGWPDMISTTVSNFVPIPQAWLNSPTGITFHIPVSAESGLTVSGVATLNNAGNSFSGNGAGLTSLSAGNITSGTLNDARLSANVALLNRANQVFTGSNSFGNTSISPAANLSFGTQPRQMLNLWGTQYGIGVQSYTLYFRTDNSFPGGGFAWYQGGVHNDNKTNSGGGTTMMTLDSTGLRVNGTFVSASDRNLKQDFAAVDSGTVLEKVAQLPIQTWAYKNDPGTKHLGPVAQDFYAAFSVGPDDRHITTVDESGVALAAIQGLNQKLEQKETEITELKQRLEALEKLIRGEGAGERLNSGARSQKSEF